MIKITRSLGLPAAAAFACVLSAAPGHAANRTFVSAVGNDANACSITQPCRTLQAAFNATSVNGEIEVLDPTGYGALVITHSVSIQGHGWASLNAGPGGTVVVINGDSGSFVNLRGLVIEGLATASTGIQFNSGFAVAITDCMVRDIAGTAIAIMPSTPNSPMRYTIADTQVLDNQGDGIDIVPQSRGVASVGLVKNVIVSNSVDGIFVDGSNGGAAVTIVSSTSHGNSDAGFAATGSTASMVIRDSTASSNEDGVLSQGAATIRIGHSVVALNTTAGLISSGGAISSYGDNDINGNTTDESGPIGAIAPR